MDKIKQKLLTDKNLSILRKKFSSKKIGLVHGVFDFFHYGHLLHIEKAKSLCDILVVSITSDKFIKKGIGRPFYNNFQRKKILSSLIQINYLYVSESESSVELINKLKPDIYFKGNDYKNNLNDITGMIKKEKDLVNKNGGKVIITDELTFSSSTLLNKYGETFNNNQKLFIKKIKNKYSFDQIKKIVESFSDLKVLVIGEAIIDEYTFCEALGKSGKEPVLIFKKLNTERYLGGILAIARHLASFCKEIRILSMVGDTDTKKKEIMNKLEKNIKCSFYVKKNSPTILKKRYIDKIDMRKVFGAYSINDTRISQKEENKMLNAFKINQKIYDLIIVADYGHGMITPKIAKYISKNKKFVSLNTQINSTNIGLRSLSKFKKIKNLVINASELRYEMNNNDLDIIYLAKKFIKKIKCDQLCVTEGKKGAFIINKKLNVFKCPAFLNKPKDKVGAGDAYLSLISLCQFKKVDINLANFIASLGAAKSADTIGNKSPIEKIEILKTISHTLK